MKYSFLFLTLLASLCLADNPTQLPEVRKEHVEKRDTNGQIVGYVDTAYRGKERSVQTVRFKKKDGQGWGMWRTFFVAGKAVMQESDDVDGQFRTVAFFNDDGMVIEMFKRHQDGSVEPLSGAELTKYEADQQQFGEQMEKVLGKISQMLQTNSPEEVMHELKSAVQQQKETGNADKK